MEDVKLYIEQFTDFQTYVQIGEHRVPLPPCPPDHEIVNYGLPLEEQRISRTTYEINGSKMYAGKMGVQIWDKIPEHKRDEIYNTEWHRRKHGCWYFVNAGGKSRKIWVPGNQYFFLNYFQFTNGTYPLWWDSQWFDFLLAQHCFNSWKHIGIMKVKGRRGGGTAIPNSLQADYIPRHFGARGGNINKTKEDARKVNFKPIVHAVLNFPAFFLPEPYRTFLGEKNGIGKAKVETLMEFKTYSKDCLNSQIDFAATTEGAYDGGGMMCLTCDEFAKDTNNDVNTFIELNVLAMMDGGIKNNIKDMNTGEPIRPAALLYLLSSIEEVDDAQITAINEAWDMCDPSSGTEELCSTYGLARYFEPFNFGFKGFMDKYGFSDVEGANKKIDAQYDQILKRRGERAARNFRRKHPRTIEEALMPSTAQTSFNPVILEKAWLNYDALELDDPKRPIRGKLVWIQKWVSVKWVPMPNADEHSKEARWICSGLPTVPNNIKYLNGELRPNNQNTYLVSIDPIDYDAKASNDIGRLSKGSLRVKRLLDMAIDGKKYDTEGKPENFGYGFETNRTVMTYCYRPEKASEFFEDMIMTSIFYGAPTGMERTSLTLRDMYVNNHLGSFLLDNDGNPITEETMAYAGVKTSIETKREFFQATEIYIDDYGLAERHGEVIKVYMKLTPENMTKNDLGAAAVIGEWYDQIRNRRFSPQNKKSANLGIIFQKAKTYAA